MAKLTGLTLPANLAHGATLSETDYDNVTTSIGVLDSIVGQREVIYSTGTKVKLLNDATVTTVASFTVPGGTLGTNNWIECVLHGLYHNPASTTRNMSSTMTYGSTSEQVNWEMEVIANVPFTVYHNLWAYNSASIQYATAMVVSRLQDANNPGVITQADITFVENSANDLTLDIALSNYSGTATTVGWTFLGCQYFLVDVS